jgi:hypothetical protein
MSEPIAIDLKKLKVIGWASEYGYSFDPSYMSDEPCPECKEKP